MNGQSIPSAPQSGPELFRAATAALFASPSVTVAWGGHQEGISLSGSSSIAAESCVADVTLALGHIEVIKDDKNVWAKLPELALDDIFGGRGAEALELLDSRFLFADLSDERTLVLSSLLAPVRSLPFLTNEVFSADSTEVTKGALITVRGQQAVTLHVTESISGSTSELAVATQGTPLVLRAVRTSGPDDTALDFTGFGRPLTVQAPPADQALDVFELAKQLDATDPSAQA